MQTSEADGHFDFGGMLRSVRCFFSLTKDVSGECSMFLYVYFGLLPCSDVRCLNCGCLFVVVSKVFVSSLFLWSSWLSCLVCVRGVGRSRTVG